MHAFGRIYCHQSGCNLKPSLLFLLSVCIFSFLCVYKAEKVQLLLFLKKKNHVVLLLGDSN